MKAGLLAAWLAVWRTPGRIWAAMIKAGSLALWLTAGAAQAQTVLTVWLVWLFRANLTSEQAFWLIVGSQVLTGAAIAALAGREISLSIGRGGITANLGRDDGPESFELPPDERVRR